MNATIPPAPCYVIVPMVRVIPCETLERAHELAATISGSKVTTGKPNTRGKVVEIQHDQ